MSSDEEPGELKAAYSVSDLLDELDSDDEEPHTQDATDSVIIHHKTDTHHEYRNETNNLNTENASTEQNTDRTNLSIKCELDTAKVSGLISESDDNQLVNNRSNADENTCSNTDNNNTVDDNTGAIKNDIAEPGYNWKRKTVIKKKKKKEKISNADSNGESLESDSSATTEGKESEHDTLTTDSLANVQKSTKSRIVSDISGRFPVFKGANIEDTAEFVDEAADEANNVNDRPAGSVIILENVRPNVTDDDELETVLDEDNTDGAGMSGMMPQGAISEAIKKRASKIRKSIGVKVLPDAPHEELLKIQEQIKGNCLLDFGN